MARIPDDELARLKAEVSIERLAEGAGVVLRRHGADLVGLCPFHDDREPSLVITPGKNLWHCFGACNAGGSVIDSVMRAEGVSFRHAVELLRTGAPIRVMAAKRGSVRRLPAPVDEGLDDDAVLDRVVGFYSQTLRESAEALGWLEHRRIAHPDAIEHFDVGFANRTLGYRLPDRQRRAGAELRGRLQALGVYRPSGHEHFAGSVVFPIRDEHGAVVEIYGRKVGDHLRAGTPAHLYLPGPHRGVWNVEALAASDEVVVAESIIDALSLWCAGFRHVTLRLRHGGLRRRAPPGARRRTDPPGAQSGCWRRGSSVSGSGRRRVRTSMTSPWPPRTRRTRSGTCCATRHGWALAPPPPVALRYRHRSRSTSTSLTSSPAPRTTTSQVLRSRLRLCRRSWCHRRRCCRRRWFRWSRAMSCGWCWGIGVGGSGA